MRYYSIYNCVFFILNSSLYFFYIYLGAVKSKKIYTLDKKKPEY